MENPGTPPKGEGGRAIALKWLRWLWPIAVVAVHDFLGIDLPGLPQ